MVAINSQARLMHQARIETKADQIVPPKARIETNFTQTGGYLGNMGALGPKMSIPMAYLVP